MVMASSSSSSSMIGLTPFGTTTTNYQTNNQLYLNQLNMLTAATNSSTISLTPENSIHSATSSTASFSPNTNSSSSSIVDSPSNSSSNSLSYSTSAAAATVATAAALNTYSNTSFGSSSSSSSSSSSYSGPTNMANQVAFNSNIQMPVYSNLTPNFCDSTTTTPTILRNESSIKNGKNFRIKKVKILRDQSYKSMC